MFALHILCQALVLVLGLAGPAGGERAVDLALAVPVQTCAESVHAGEPASGPEHEVVSAERFSAPALEKPAEVEEEDRPVACFSAPGIDVAHAIPPCRRIGVHAAATALSAPVTVGRSRAPPALG